MGIQIVDLYTRLTRAFVSQSLGRQYFGYDVSPTTVEKVRHELKEHDLDAVIHEETTKQNATPDNFAHMVWIVLH